MTWLHAPAPPVRRVTTVATVVVLACTAGAEAATGAERSPVSHGQLVERAFSICATASNRIRVIRPATTLRHSAATTAAVIGHLRRVIVKLGALEPPAADRAPLRRYLSLLRQEVAALGRARDAARRGNGDAFSTAYQDAAGVSLQARAIANRLELAVCSTL